MYREREYMRKIKRDRSNIDDEEREREKKVERQYSIEKI